MRLAQLEVLLVHFWGHFLHNLVDFLVVETQLAVCFIGALQSSDVTPVPSRQDAGRSVDIEPGWFCGRKTSHSLLLLDDYRLGIACTFGQFIAGEGHFGEVGSSGLPIIPTTTITTATTTSITEY